MRKFLFLALTIVLIFTTGCGSGDEIKIGIIRHLNVTEEALDNFYEETNKLNPGQQAKYVFFNNMTTMLAALKSGQIDEMTTYESVADYLAAKDNSLEWEMSSPQMSDNFCCAMLDENAALKNEFDDALAEISSDGTLAKLVKTYIVGINKTVPLLVEMPTFYNAPTIKVAVTGDLPPLDYMSADGKPAGFNTAILAEISKRLEKNFVLVPVDAGSRALALMSKKVDVIFWVVVPVHDEATIPSNFDVPDGVILTNPYFTDEIVHVKVRENS